MCENRPKFSSFVLDKSPKKVLFDKFASLFGSAGEVGKQGASNSLEQGEADNTNCSFPLFSDAPIAPTGGM